MESMLLNYSGPELKCVKVLFRKKIRSSILMSSLNFHTFLAELDQFF